MNTVQNFEIDGGRVARFTRGAVAAAVMVVIAACGGGGGGSPTGPAGGETPPEVIAVQKPSATEASRFLAQATMGRTEAEINRLTGMTYAEWLDEQFAKPQSLHRLYINQAAADLASVGQQLSQQQFLLFVLEPGDHRRGPAAPARRLRALADLRHLAQRRDRRHPRGVASYYDMLARNAFGNYRTLLDDVSLHPMMGLYLTFLANQKEDAAGTRTPDENYAREVMQLMTIGLRRAQQRRHAARRWRAASRSRPTPPPTSPASPRSSPASAGTRPTPTNNTFFGGGANARSRLSGR